MLDQEQSVQHTAKVILNYNSAPKRKKGPKLNSPPYIKYYLITLVTGKGLIQNSLKRTSIVLTSKFCVMSTTLPESEVLLP